MATERTLIVDFAGYGVWVWRNEAVWSQLHQQNTQGITVADLDRNGREDVVIDFGAAGLWAWQNDANWAQLHSFNPEAAVAGDFIAQPTPGGTFPALHVWGGPSYTQYLGFFTCVFCTEYATNSINNLSGVHGNEYLSDQHSERIYHNTVARI